jgi:hypothetical protein
MSGRQMEDVSVKTTIKDSLRSSGFYRTVRFLRCRKAAEGESFAGSILAQMFLFVKVSTHTKQQIEHQ